MRNKLSGNKIWIRNAETEIKVQRFKGNAIGKRIKEKKRRKYRFLKN